MISLSAAQETELATGRVRTAEIFDIDLPAPHGIQRFTTAGHNVITGGNTYPAANDMIYLSDIEEDSENVATAWEFGLSFIDPSRIDQIYNLALQGRMVTRRRVLINQSGAVMGSPIEVSIREMYIDVIEEGPTEARVKIIAETFIAEQRDPTYSTRTDSSQQARFPGDDFFADVMQVVRGIDIQLRQVFQRQDKT